MNDIALIPPNLMTLGVRRRQYPEADLETIWLTPYPMLTNYELMCKDLRIDPYGGGTRQRQGDRWRPGYILSGYRDEIVDGNGGSPHFRAAAIDMTAPGGGQILMAQVADWHFTRVGLYPQNNFLHVDLMPRIYWERYGLAKYWVRISGKYHHFDTLEEAIEFAKPTFV